jgi:hypothetical protein
MRKRYGVGRGHAVLLQINDEAAQPAKTASAPRRFRLPPLQTRGVGVTRFVLGFCCGAAALGLTPFAYAV